MRIDGKASLKLRLASYRAKAAKEREVFNGDCHYCQQFREALAAKGKTQCHYCEKAAASTWRDYRPDASRPSAGNWYKQDNGDRVYLCDEWPAGWRDLGDCHDVARGEGSRCVEHTGWYADHYYHALIIGRVLQLPARNGRPQYVPAVYCDEWDGVTIHLGDICDSKIDAAMRADHLAELWAEECREDDARQAAESESEELLSEIKQTRQEALALLREMRPLRKAGDGSPAICNALRARLETLLEDIRTNRDRIAALSENYWLAVEGW